MMTRAFTVSARLTPKAYVVSIKITLGAAELGLTVCMRCDRDILELGLFVAEQDYRRIPKDIHSEEGRAGGEVFLLRFDDQNAEAAGIADLCAALMRRSGLKAEDILILLRNDSKGGLSNPIKRETRRSGNSGRHHGNTRSI